jgi:hypothetical protein
MALLTECAIGGVATDCYSCASFIGDSLLVGVADRGVYQYDFWHNEPVDILELSDEVHHIRVSNHTPRLLLTSSNFYQTQLWDVSYGAPEQPDGGNIGQQQRSTRKRYSFLPLFSLEGGMGEFTSSNDLVLTTTEQSSAALYAVETGTRLLTFDAINDAEASHDLAKQHMNNAASFSPDERLVLFDCCLWDLRAARRVHRFDRLSNYSRGMQSSCKPSVCTIDTFRSEHGFGRGLFGCSAD